MQQQEQEKERHPHEDVVHLIEEEEVIHVSVISIRQERLQHFFERTRECLPLGRVVVKVCNGVDGRSLDLQQLIRDGTIVRKKVPPRKKGHPPSPLTRGELGCFLSHRSIWQQMVDIDAQAPPMTMQLIFEDDVALNASMGKKLSWILEILKRNETKWDLCYICYNLLRGSDERGGTETFHPAFRKIRNGWTTLCGYILNRRAASVLYHQSLPIGSLPCDLYIGAVAQRAAAGLRRFRVFPPLCSELGTHSDTQSIR
jgi:collagen beta-1,O-galactosyltransferase